MFLELFKLLAGKTPTGTGYLMNMAAALISLFAIGWPWTLGNEQLKNEYTRTGEMVRRALAQGKID